MFRAGSDDAFRVIHERYHARLLAYARQMLRGSGGDAEDALQDVFVRAFRALRASNRPVLLRAWLYRIAHNRCIDELRRPVPIPAALELDARPAIASAGAGQDPSVQAERSEAVARLVADVRTLPVGQRSALLMREVQGMSYQELAETLGLTVPAVKSLLLRARTGLLELKLARETPCREIQLALAEASDRGVRMNARCRRHVRECPECRSYHRGLRVLDRRLAALAPVGPLAKLSGLLGFSGGGTSAAGGGAAGAGAGASVTGGGATIVGGATVAKVAAVVATAAVIGTTAPVAIQAVGGSRQPIAVLPADAGAITRATGAAVGPSSAAVNAGLASPPAGPDESAAVALASTGPSGVTGATGASGASGVTGATGASAAPTGVSDGSTDTLSASAPPPADGYSGATGPTASAASVPDGSSGESVAPAPGATAPNGGTSGPSGGSTAPRRGTSGASGGTSVDGGTAAPSTGAGSP
ncbi:MAG TPA: sigma-70 family RNA polymerase sigma factor [Solirubrobacteraceae bacterium]|nr:sigma-70 family RNA polymerase sigma factor [Solirubrobacteraceae bacterium]